MSRATAKANLRSVPLDDGVLCGTDWPLLPDAEYVCAVLRHETLAIFRSARVMLHMEIVEGPHAGSRIFAAFNVQTLVGKPGPGGRFKVSRRSALVQTLARITGKRMRGDRLRLRWMRHCLFTVRTRTVVRDSKQRALPEQLRYSVVGDILNITVGFAP